MFITDKGLRTAGVTAPLEESLSKNDIHCVLYDGTNPNPTVKNVEEARELYVGEKCEAVLTFSFED